MTIVWQPTLAAVDASPAVTSSLGQTIRNQLANAGQAYDRFFPPGSATTLVESAAHRQWSSDVPRFLSAQDDAARLVEGEAARLNGSPVFTTPLGSIVLAPAVPIAITSQHNLAESLASLTVGAFTFTAIEPGALGNQIGVSVTTVLTQNTIVVSPPNVTPPVTVTLPPALQSTLTTTLGSYSETLLVGTTGKLVRVGYTGAPLAEGTVSGSLSGATGEANSIKRRLDRAVGLQGMLTNGKKISDGLLALALSERAKTVPIEPAFYDSRYYALAVLRSRSSTQGRQFTKLPDNAPKEARQSVAFWTQRGNAAEVEQTIAYYVAKAREDAERSRPRGPTYGSIETGLTSALSAAQALLAA